jgi:hypothetical protein
MEERKKTTMSDRRSLTLYQYLNLLLLVVILMIGFFHYSTLNTSQKAMTSSITSVQGDLQEVRQEYVKLREYVSGQQVQDAEIQQIKTDLVLIKKSIGDNKRSF